MSTSSTKKTSKVLTQLATKGEVKSTIDEYNKVIEANYPNKWTGTNTVYRCSSGAASTKKSISSDTLRLLPGTSFLFYLENSNTAETYTIEVTESGVLKSYKVTQDGTFNIPTKKGLYVATVSDDGTTIDLSNMAKYLSVSASSTDKTVYPLFSATTESTGNEVNYDVDFTYNASTNTLTAKNVNVTTKATIAELQVTGKTTLGAVGMSDITATSLTASNNITVTSTTLKNVLPVLESTSITSTSIDTSTLTASSKVKTATLEATGNGTITGTLGVTGATTLSSSASVGGTLKVTGATTLTSLSASSITDTELTASTAVVTDANKKLVSRTIVNNGEATAITASTSIPTMNTLYYGLPTINSAHNYTSSSTIFAPTTAGTANYVLTSSGGTSAPVWTSLASSFSGATSKTLTALTQGANGKITDVTFSDIAITKSQVTDFPSSIKNPTSITFQVDNAATPATSSYDGSTAVTISNIKSASKLATGRTILTNLASTGAATFDGTANVTPGVSGILPVANGGTGNSTLNGAANALINSLSAEDSVPGDNDYYVCQSANGGTTTTTYHRRPLSLLWTWIAGKISSVLGLTASSYSGKAANATKADSATSATTASKLGSTNVGSGIIPMYLVSGIATASTSTVGAWNKPVFLSSGTITACGTSIGGVNTPVYMNAGVITAGNAYGGGTAVTLNGASKAAQTASFFAPTTTGTANYVLKSAGSGAPVWTDAISGVSISGGTCAPTVLVIPTTASTTVGAIWYA